MTRTPRTAVYQGEPCKSGHSGLRYVNDRRCVECRTATWEKRRVARAQYAKQWACEHPDKKRDTFASWRQRNAEHDRMKSLEWQQSNPARAYAAIAKRKAALLQRIPSWANLEAIQKFYDLAVEISVRTGVPHEVDHIYPLQGKVCSGLHVENNLQVITAVENRRKGNRIA